MISCSLQSKAMKISNLIGKPSRRWPIFFTGMKLTNLKIEFRLKCPTMQRKRRSSADSETRIGWMSPCSLRNNYSNGNGRARTKRTNAGESFPCGNTYGAPIPLRNETQYIFAEYLWHVDVRRCAMALLGIRYPSGIISESCRAHCQRVPKSDTFSSGFSQVARQNLTFLIAPSHTRTLITDAIRTLASAEHVALAPHAVMLQKSAT